MRTRLAAWVSMSCSTIDSLLFHAWWGGAYLCISLVDCLAFPHVVDFVSPFPLSFSLCSGRISRRG